LGDQLISLTVDIVERYQDGDDNQGDGDEDDQEGLEVSQKEVGIQTTFVDNLAIPKRHQGHHHAPWCCWWRLGPLTLGNKIGLGFAGVGLRLAS
jgi:hypothetical protein